MAQVPLYILALGAFWGVVGVLANRYKVCDRMAYFSCI